MRTRGRVNASAPVDVQFTAVENHGCLAEDKIDRTFDITVFHIDSAKSVSIIGILITEEFTVVITLPVAVGAQRHCLLVGKGPVILYRIPESALHRSKIT